MRSNFSPLEHFAAAGDARKTCAFNQQLNLVIHCNDD